MAVCPHCSDTVPASARFCPGCGAAAAPDPTAAYVPPPPPEGAARFATGQVLAGRYRVVADLGKGGMGEVYRADDLTLGQPVALKFLPAHLADDPDRLARFRKEVAVARRVSHPHVCRVYDITEHAGQSFLTMEFVDGEDLAALLKRVGRLPVEKGIEISRQLCAALGAVHDQGLLHRDLKPANVMLDGRGRVRLTDFGLTAAAADLSATEVRSGTPLYMAPEQHAGREVTARSDVYALGLVLYEVFTGRRAFAGKDRDDPPSKPSSHVTGLDPAVERVILKCLEADPADRPKSAAEVMAGLPGGDPLAAAVAAGETPSPRLVADAPVEGTLRPAVAAAMFVGIVACLLLIAGLNDRYKAHRHVPLPPPAVLEEKARALVRDLGYTDPPADTADGFEMPAEHQRYMAQHGGEPAVPLEQMPLCRPALAVYWHRQSPRPLLPTRTADFANTDSLSPTNPPADEPGMVTVKIDTRGRLVGLLAVPDPATSLPPKPVDWDALLKAAELDTPGALRSDPSAAPTPPVFADKTAAWDGTYLDRPDLAIRVEAASYRGRPVYFRITHPDWGEPPRDRAAPIAQQNAGFYLFFTTVFGLAAAAIFFLAVRNVWRGRADTRGALILAAAVCVFQVLAVLLGRNQFAGLPQLVPQFFYELETILIGTALLSACYLALEPVVRRRCPHQLTAWTRLTSGRWRDPLVGRDILVGGLIGVVASLDGPTRPFWMHPTGPTVVLLPSYTHPVANLAAAVAAALWLIWLWAGGLYGVLLAVGRRQWVALTLLGLIIGLLYALDPATPVSTRVFALVMLAVSLVQLWRFGFLCLIASTVPQVALSDAPLTLDPSAWYFGASLTYLLALVGLAGYGAVVAVGGRSFFKGVLGDD